MAQELKNNEQTESGNSILIKLFLVFGGLTIFLILLKIFVF